MTKIKKQTTIKFMPPAPQGKAGPSYYPAGVWNVNAVYKYTDKSVPVVNHRGLYYALNDNENTRKGLQGGVEPHLDTNKVNWTYIEKQQYVFTDVAFIEFGKLGSSIFNGDFMFSQHGRDGSGQPIETEGAYKDFTPGNPMGGPFRPNILMNMFTGESWFQNTNVEGSLTAGYVSYKVKTGGGSLEGYAMAYGGGEFTLPPIESGKTLVISAYCPSLSRTAPTPLVIKSTSSSPILAYDADKGYAVNTTALTLEYNKVYTLIGVGLGINGNVIGDGISTWFAGSTVGGSGQGATIVVDTELKSDSDKPIANKAVYNKFVDVEKKLGNKIVKVDSAPGSNADPNTLYVITT